MKNILTEWQKQKYDDELLSEFKPYIFKFGHLFCCFEVIKDDAGLHVAEVVSGVTSQRERLLV